MVIHHQKMKLFFIAVLLVVDCGKQHATGIDAHHLPRREIGDGDQCLSDQFFRLIVSMDTGKNDSVCACSIIQSELKELLRLWNGLTCLNLNCSEVTLAESIEIYCILKERLYSYIAEIDLVVRSEEAVIVVCLLILMYLSVILTIALECRDDCSLYCRYPASSCSPNMLSSFSLAVTLHRTAPYIGISVAQMWYSAFFCGTWESIKDSS